MNIFDMNACSTAALSVVVGEESDLFYSIALFSCQKLLVAFFFSLFFPSPRGIFCVCGGGGLSIAKYMKKVTQSSDAVNYQPCINKKVISWLTVTPAFLRMCVVKRFSETMDVNGTK